mgnify:CR=1 FL=1|tara:strand:+ start:3093 stop:3299 length:207 start_codon:yes stop_codon:yes gene_type:complete
MRTFHIVLEIKIHEDIEDLLPNFDIFHEDVEGFISNKLEDIEDDNMDNGYSIKVTDGKMLLPITFSDN